MPGQTNLRVCCALFASITCSSEQPAGGLNGGPTGYRYDPENPAEPGWGGQYVQGKDNKWLDGSGASIKTGRESYQAEFAERVDWMVHRWGQ